MKEIIEQLDIQLADVEQEIAHLREMLQQPLPSVACTSLCEALVDTVNARRCLTSAVERLQELIETMKKVRP